MYTRASASDYDDFQCKGWTTKELLPLMKKHETYQRSCQNRDLHGFDGPIKVSFGNYCYPIMQDFLRAAESQDIPVTDDLQDLVTGHGAEHWLKWVSGPLRASTPVNKMTQQLTRSIATLAAALTALMHIFTALVPITRTYTWSATPKQRSMASSGFQHVGQQLTEIRVIIEGGRATGVKTVPTKPLHPNEQKSKTYKARKFIIISGGTLSSPLILQRSGIGDPAKLRKAGVKPLVDLPGVGLNFQDHCKSIPAALAGNIRI